jgi:hypothetical protein
MRPDRSLPVNGSEPLAAGTGVVGTATGALPPAFAGVFDVWRVSLWPCALTGFGLPLEPLVDEVGPPPEPEVLGGGCCGYWSAAACR